MNAQAATGEGNREIPRILNELRSECAIQEKLVAQLVDRLYPIMVSREPTPKPSAGGEVPISPRTPVGEMLQNEVDNTRRANESLANIINNVQL
jgi:hypothetical protein